MTDNVRAPASTNQIKGLVFSFTFAGDGSRPHSYRDLKLKIYSFAGIYSVAGTAEDDQYKSAIASAKADVDENVLVSQACVKLHGRYSAKPHVRCMHLSTTVFPHKAFYYQNPNP